MPGILKTPRTQAEGRPSRSVYREAPYKEELVEACDIYKDSVKHQDNYKDQQKHGDIYTDKHKHQDIYTDKQKHHQTNQDIYIDMQKHDDIYKDKQKQHDIYKDQLKNNGIYKEYLQQPKKQNGLNGILKDNDGKSNIKDNSKQNRPPPPEYPGKRSMGDGLPNYGSLPRGSQSKNKVKPMQDVVRESQETFSTCKYMI